MNQEKFKLRIDDRKLHVNLGCTNEERNKAQIVALNLEIQVEGSKAYKSDAIGDTLNYLEVVALIERCCEKSSWALLERMSFELCSLLFESFASMTAIKIEISKNVIRNAKAAWISREITRQDWAERA